MRKLKLLLLIVFSAVYALYALYVFITTGEKKQPPQLLKASLDENLGHLKAIVKGGQAPPTPEEEQENWDKNHTE